MILRDQKPFFQESFQSYFKTIKGDLPNKLPLYKDQLIPLESPLFFKFLSKSQAKIGLFISEQSISHPSGNKYLPLVLQVLETRLPKLQDPSFSLLQKLLSKGLIRLSGPAFAPAPALDPPISRLPETTASAWLIKSLISLPSLEKEDPILPMVLKLLRMVFFSDPTPSLSVVNGLISFLIRAYASVKKAETQFLVKSHVASDIGLVFQRLGELKERDHPPTFFIHNAFDVFFGKNKEKQTAMTKPELKQFQSLRSQKKREKSMDFAILMTQSSFGSPFSAGTFFSELDAKNELFLVRNMGEHGEYKPAESPEMQGLEGEIRTVAGEHLALIVDEVVLGLEAGLKGRLVPREIAAISLEERSFTDVRNEIGLCSGIFGWCVMCRNPADFYCISSRFPLCSAKCKAALHLKDQHRLKMLATLAPNGSEALAVFIEVLRICLRNSLKDPSSAETSQPDFKGKLFSLETLSGCLDYFSSFFAAYKPAFLEVKDLVCEAVLRNCLSPEKQVFVISFKLLLILILSFRELLNPEICILFEQILLRVLNTPNSHFSHRFYALQILSKIMGNWSLVVGFFLDYDCELGAFNVIEKTFETLGKISQGKYSKEEFSALLQPSQEVSLRIQALDCLGNFFSEVCNAFEEVEDQEIEGNVPEEESVFEKAKTMKEEIAKSILKFNNKPESGVKGLINIALANFLRSTPEINKDKLGEYLAKPENESLLVEFTKLCEFQDKSLETALRDYLELFTLPGESQQVDRVLQAFSQRFFSQNPLCFKSSEVVYLLSYSMMILQTDLHNPQVKEKMRFTDFAKMTSRINDGCDLDQQFLRGLYQGINDRPLAIHQSSHFNTRASDDKAELFRQESRNILEKGKEALIRLKTAGRRLQNQQMTRISHLQSKGTIKLMLKSIWSPVFAAFSVGLGNSASLLENEERFIEVCLTGLENMLKLAGLLQMSDIRDTLLVTLIKFTNVRGSDFNRKNLDCLKRLLGVLGTHGKHMGKGWKYIVDLLESLDIVMKSKSVDMLLEVDPFLVERVTAQTMMYDGDTMLLIVELFIVKALSEGERMGEERIAIERARIGERMNEESMRMNEEEATRMRITEEAKRNNEKGQRMNEQGEEAIKNPIEIPKNPIEITRDMTSIPRNITSIPLNIMSIPRNMNIQPLQDPPSIECYALKKLLEIAEENMLRSGDIWKTLWAKVSRFLTEIAASNPKQTGFFVVDALKRLTIRFFQNEEVLGLQTDVFTPFEHIFLGFPPEHIETKELLITSLISLLQAYTYKLKAAWRVVLSLCNHCLSEAGINLTILAHRILKMIVMDAQNMSNFLEIPRELLKTLYLASNSCQQDSLRSETIDFLMRYLRFLFSHMGILPLSDVSDGSLSPSDPLLLHSVDRNTEDTKVRINLSSVVEESQHLSFRNSEDIGIYFLNDFNDSILSSPTFDCNRRSSVLREQPGFNEEDWFEIFANLKEKLRDQAIKVRETALEALFSLLLSFGYSFQTGFWLRVYQEILRKAFADLAREFTSRNIMNTELNVLRFLLKKAVSSLAKLQGLHMSENEAFLREFLEIVAVFGRSSNDFLAKLGLGALKTVVLRVGKRFSKGCWRVLVGFLCERMDEALPKELMNKENLELAFPKSCNDLMKGFGSATAVFRPVKLGFDAKEVITKSMSILMIIGIIAEIPVTGLAIEEIESLVKSLEKCRDFVVGFNEMTYLRYCLWKNGFLQEMKELPGLLKQEKEAIFCLARLEIQAFNCKAGEDRIKAHRFLDDFINNGIETANKFNGLCERAIKKKKENDFLDKIHRRNLSNHIIEISGSKTPDSRLNLKARNIVDFSVTVEEFDINLNKSGKKKLLIKEKNNSEQGETVEAIIKELETAENNRRISNLMPIVCFFVNSLTEIKPSDVKSIKKLVCELINLSKNGMSHCLSCGINESEETVGNLTEVLMKCYEYAFNKM